MRILTLTHCLGSGGAEILSYRLSCEFARLGHQTHLAYLTDARSIRTSVELEEKMKAELVQARVSVHEIGKGFRTNPIKAAFRLWKIIRSVQPDVLHIHVPFGLLLRALVPTKVITVYTHHSIRLNARPSAFRLFDRFVSTYVGICRTCSEMLREHVRKPVELIYNGVPSKFAIDRSRETLPRHPTILSVGVLRDAKDYPTLLEAAAMLVEKMGDGGRQMRFQIAGGGAEEAPLRRSADQLGLTQRVEFLGTRLDIAQLMAEADLLVSSSIYEGFPISMIEAAQSALPVVATNVGGVPEIVEDGTNGFLVPPRRPDLLAEKIGEALSNEKVYLSLSQGGKTKAELFTIETCAAQHVALYERLTSD